MNRFHKLLAGTAGVLTLVAATVVVAAPRDGMAGCDGMGHMGMMHGGRHGGEPGAMAEQHLAKLKTQLKITAQQEPAWQAFAAKATEQAKAMQAQAAQRPAAAGSAALPAPERMAQHLGTLKQRLAGMETMQAALKDLYAALTPEQRTAADQHFGQMGRMGRHGMGHGGRG